MISNAFLGLCSLYLQQEDTTKQRIISRPSGPQLEKIRLRATPGTARSIEDILADAEEIFSYGYKVGHPRFFSCIPSPASPLSWLGDALTSAFNPFGGSWDAASGVCTVEASLIEWIADRFGLPPSAGGQFVSGASMANLTAMTVARDQMLQDETRSKGVVYISSQAHFCIAKGLRIIGLSEKQIRTIDCDESFQMDIAKLSLAISKDRQSDFQPFLIVATCGTTSTGSIDPLKKIAEIAKEHRMWMHVDAAYGGSAAFSHPYRARIDGLGLADSIAWDAHKWLFQTHGCAAVFFRKKSHPLRSFATSGHYVQDVEDIEFMRDPWNYGIELTRPARHMRLWFSLQLLGTDMLSQMVSHGIELAAYAEAQLRKREGWEVISSSGLAILTFRFVPNNIDTVDVDSINTLISKEILARNVAAIFTVTLEGKICLRMCTINPQTTEADIESVVHTLDDIAHSI